LRDVLCGLARQALNASLFEYSAESRVLLFAGGITADAGVWDFLCGTLDCSATAEGTDIAGASYTALDRLAASHLPVEIWLFTDGQGSLAPDDLTARLRQAHAGLRVWEATSDIAPSPLCELVAAVGGDYRKIP
jgi:hypothetical protein